MPALDRDVAVDDEPFLCSLQLKAMRDALNRGETAVDSVSLLRTLIELEPFATVEIGLASDEVLHALELVRREEKFATNSAVGAPYRSAIRTIAEDDSLDFDSRAEAVAHWRASSKDIAAAAMRAAQARPDGVTSGIAFRAAFMQEADQILAECRRIASGASP